MAEVAPRLLTGLEHRVIAFTLGGRKPELPGGLVELIESLKLDVRFSRLPPGVSGRTWYDGSRPRIEVDPDTSLGRANFTVAHELGHLLVDRWRELSNASALLPAEEHLEEMLCDRIAAEILMPTAWARTRAATTEPPVLPMVVDVAKEAGVTLAAAAVRLQRVGLRFQTWRMLRSSRSNPSWTVVYRDRFADGGVPTDELLGRLDALPKLRVIMLDPRESLGPSGRQVEYAAVHVSGSSAMLLASEAAPGVRFGPGARHHRRSRR